MAINQFRFKYGSTILVTDPSTPKKLGSVLGLNVRIDNCWQGEWAVLQQFDSVYRDRVQTLLALPLDTEPEVLLQPEAWKIMGWVGVDTSQLGLFDYSLYPENTSEIDLLEQSSSRITQEADGGVVENLGVVSTSGFGDGQYPVVAFQNSQGQVCAVAIQFITEQSRARWKELRDRWKQENAPT